MASSLHKHSQSHVISPVFSVRDNPNDSLGYGIP